MKFTEVGNLAESIYGKSLAPIRMFIETKAEAWEQESILPSVFNTQKSDSWAEKVTGLTATDGFMPVGENGAHPHDQMQEGYSKTIEHMTWKDSFALSREIVDDGKLMDMKSRPQAFVNGFYRTREMFGAALLGNAIQGNTSATFKGASFDCASADGLSMFNTAHTSKVSGGTQSNCFSNAFSLTALNKVQAAMQLFKGDNGEILNVSPKTILIPVDAALREAVFQAIGSHEIPGQANRGNNVQMGMWNVVTWPYLNQFITSGTSPWVLIDDDYNEANGGGVWFDRVELEVTERIDNNNALVHDGYARFGAGFADWRAFAVGGVTGGTSL